MPNLVEIVITGKNLVGPALKAAESQTLSFGSVMSKVGTASVAAVAGIAVASIKMAADFQSAMMLLHTQAGVAINGPGGVNDLSDKVLSLAGKVGFSPDSLAEALYHIESAFHSAGMSGSQSMALLQTAANGAAVGHANLVDVTNALDAAVVSGIPGVQNYNQAMGALNATVGGGDMMMQDLANAMGTGMVAAVKGFGLNITDVGAALATFGDNNIRGAKAGTDLRMAVQALASPMAHGAGLTKLFGTYTGQLADDMRTGGLLKALEDLQTRFDAAGISADKQGQIITDAFGKKAGVGLMVLMGQMGRFQSKYADITAASKGFANAVAANNATAAQKFNDLKAAADASLIRIGDKLLPDVTKLLDFIDAHWSVISKLAGAFIALSAALKVAAVAQTALDIAFAGSGIGALIELLGILLLLIVKYHTQIWAFLKKGWNDAVNFVVQVIVGWIKTIKDVHDKIVAFFVDVDNFILSIPSHIRGIGDQIFHAIVDGLVGIDKWIDYNVVNPIVNFITSIPSRIGNVGSRIGHAITSGISGAASSILHGFAGGGIIGGAAGGGVRGGWVQVGEHGRELVRLPGGSTVFSNPDSQRMMGGGSGGVNVNLGIVSSGQGDFDRFMLWWLRDRVKNIGGGSVQAAFGRG